MIAWSGLRVWQAPASPARIRALTLFGASRILDTLWLWLGFRGHRLGAMAAKSVFAITAVGTYAQQAARLDRRAGLLVLPHVAWLGFAALLSEELGRRNG